MSEDKCTCVTCGYQWTKGQNGSHSCVPYLQATIKKLEKNEKYSGQIKTLEYFEVFDRAHVANDHFHEYIEKHQVVQNHKELKFEAEAITKMMYNFYCLCGSYYKQSKV